MQTNYSAHHGPETPQCGQLVCLFDQELAQLVVQWSVWSARIRPQDVYSKTIYRPLLQPSLLPIYNN